MHIDVVFFAIFCFGVEFDRECDVGWCYYLEILFFELNLACWIWAFLSSFIWFKMGGKLGQGYVIVSVIDIGVEFD